MPNRKAKDRKQEKKRIRKELKAKRRKIRLEKKAKRKEQEAKTPFEKLVDTGQVVEIPEVKDTPKVEVYDAETDKMEEVEPEDIGMFKKMVNKWKDLADN